MSNKQGKKTFDLWSSNRERSKQTLPFPHIMIDNFLPQGLIESFFEEIKGDNDFFEHYGWGGKRISVRYGTNEYNSLLKNSDSFNKIHSLLNTPRAVEGLYDWFREDIVNSGLKSDYLNLSKLKYNSDITEYSVTSNFFIRLYHKIFLNPIIRGYSLRRYYRRFMRYLSLPAIYPLFSYSQSSGGYVEPTHTDSRHKVFICLIYLDDMGDGGELVIQKNKKDKKLSSCKAYPLADEIEASDVIKPRRNRFICFINQNNAYHSTLPFIGLRRFIYFAYAVSNEESAFKTDYEVQLGDAGNTKRV